MTDDVDALIERVSEESGKSIEAIRKKMAERKEKTHGLLSDYGAVYAVAKEFGIDVSETEIKLTDIGSIKPTSSVNVVGRVKVVFSPREFKRKDGSTGRFASISIIDDSGEIRVVLWDQNTEVVKKIRVGDVMMVRNGYAKDNRGTIEVHGGNLSNILVNPANISVKLPEVTENIAKIDDLAEDMPSVTLICRVNAYYPATEFSRSDGSTGKRASIIGEDESGTIRIVLWDSATELDVGEGDFIKLENAYTRKGLNDEVELQAGNRSRIMRSDSKLELPPLEKKTAGKVKIKDIKSDLRNFILESRVLRVYAPREYSKGQLASLIVGDKSGTIRVVLWDEKAAITTDIKDGDAILLKNAYARANLNDEPEVHIGKYGEVVIDDTLKVPTVGQISSSMTTEKSISDLENNDRFIKISGKVMDVEERPLIFMNCGECGKKVQNLGGEWLCDACGMVEASPNMLASVIIEDSSANIRAVAFRDKAEAILGLDLEEAMNLIGESQDEKAPIENAREKIVGTDISLIGRVNYNDFSDQLEFIVEDVA